MQTQSIIGRVALALVLTIGFYLLATAIAAGLLWIPYAEVVYAHRITPKLDLICLLGGLAILISILPRFDRFTAPGPQLTREKHPRLFAELDTVATATKQEMPSEVYLIPDVNAWVMQRGGVMGFGSRRVMGLGLPLMRILTCAQFRAVLAHEFGHYHGGDTKVGPWIYKTRAAIVRTVVALGHGSILQTPFRWYAKMFLRVTHAVSRRQEFIADELAARTVGAKPLQDGLCTIHKAAPAFSYYWQSECGPVLSAGFLPPVSEGFNQFMAAGGIAEKMDQHLQESLANGKVNPYDTHPPLKERVAAVSHLEPRAVVGDDPRAETLLDENVATLERQLLVCVAGAQKVEALKSIDWNDVGAKVYLPQWTRLVQINSAGLQGVTPGDFSILIPELKKRGVELVTPSGQKAAATDAEALANAVFSAALTLLVIQQGGRLDTTPGNEITVELSGTSVKTFAIITELKNGTITAEAWAETCEKLGISKLDLGSVVQAETPVEPSTGSSV